MEEPRSGCPINAAVEALGDHWSLLVLRDVIFGDRRYFRELHAGSKIMSRNTSSDQWSPSASIAALIGHPSEVLPPLPP